MLSFLPPMLATSGRPRGALDGWVVEPKADGWRVQVAISDGRLRAWTRSGRDITANLPELSALADLGAECVLDGELIAGAGLPTDFYGLVGLVSARRRRAPVTFAAFDVLHLDGRSLLGYDQASRRQALECLARLSDGALTTVRSFPGSDLDAVLAGCESLGMEGVVVKRRDSLYRPGRRTNDWRKVKCAGWRAQHAERRLKVRPDLIPMRTHSGLVAEPHDGELMTRL